jgi:flagellin
MALSVGTNTGALMAQAAASSVNKSMESSMERLATGKRINSASDDAAGVAIASRLTSEIRGTNQAIRNAMDGQAMLDTAEGAHIEVENILQRMREISVQAANGTNNADDRTNLQLEMTQLTTEIDRISSTTSWAGQKLIDGTGSFTLQLGSQTSAADSITASINSISAATLGVGAGGSTTTANTATLAEAGNTVIQIGGTPAAGDVFNFTVGSENLAVRVDSVAADVAVTAVADAGLGNTAVSFATSAAGVNTLTVTATGAGGQDKYNLTINGTTLEVAHAASATANTNATTIKTAIDASNLGLTVTDNSDGTLTIAPQTNYSTSLDGGVTFNAAGTETAIAKNGIAGLADAIAKEINDLTATKYIGLTASAAADGTVTVDQAVIFSNTTIAIAADASAAGSLNSAGTVLTIDAAKVVKADTISFDINGETITTGTLVTTDSFADTVSGTQAKIQAVIDANAKLSGLGLTAAVSSTNITITAAKLTTTLIKDVSAVAASSTTATAGLSVTTTAGATSAVDAIDTAIKTINNQRATLGSISNRLDSTVSNLTNISSNLSAGRGRIEDADFAAETTNLAKTQILQQASTAMLAQANASKQGVLSLLQG